ncbi:uncharacterized protein SCHCODRAFT_02577906 [Schizophyllum commune H4-8]|uniref:Expressed protein n=1 Tax=Schizophyllum commune (strain H4-8 / FGSC 9210) TaxID=578458 RepID=D8Q5Q8_SCHCM|nr:uncharacterized protein SCHCODRAFT_02577906 [Schizophyllum commune H4-8]KAI5892074.1 hypothetical protein SCHCODRAFT_02577906 [Schizophyllum commune H4-8]
MGALARRRPRPRRRRSSPRPSPPPPPPPLRPRARTAQGGSTPAPASLAPHPSTCTPSSPHSSCFSACPLPSSFALSSSGGGTVPSWRRPSATAPGSHQLRARASTSPRSPSSTKPSSMPTVHIHKTRSGFRGTVSSRSLLRTSIHRIPPRQRPSTCPLRCPHPRQHGGDGGGRSPEHVHPTLRRTGRQSLLSGPPHTRLSRHACVSASSSPCLRRTRRNRRGMMRSRYRRSSWASLMCTCAVGPYRATRTVATNLGARRHLPSNTNGRGGADVRL